MSDGLYDYCCDLELDVHYWSDRVAELEQAVSERDELIRELFHLVHYGPCRAECDHYDKDVCGVGLYDGVCWYEVRLKEMGVEL